MYKVLKPAGHNANVVVENTDTKANVIIGRLSLEMLKILEDAGFKIENYTDEINLKISKVTAIELQKLALSMKKPIRDQSKKAKDLFKKPNKEIDAMDVLLGLASYS